MKRFEKKKQSTNLYTKLNVYFCSKNPMYEPFLCGCYGNLNRICIATTNESFEKTHVCLQKRCSIKKHLNNNKFTQIFIRDAYITNSKPMSV